MHKGKILKVRPGHEANCSSGMIAMFVLMAGGTLYLPLAMITAIVQATGSSKAQTTGDRKWRYWIVPQILGLVPLAHLVHTTYSSGYGVTLPLLISLAMGLAFALTTAAGYILAPRIRYWLCLLVPVLLVLFFVIGLLAFEEIVTFVGW